jgi:arsenite methyltransferase
MTFYDELPFWSAPFGLALLETVRIGPRMRVLDIGSGSGFPMLELADRLDHGSHVTGIDPTPESLRMIGDKLKDRGISNAEILPGRAEELPFGDDEFDLVISNNGLNNTEDLPLSAAECFRVLKPAGQMVFTVNLPHTFTEFYEVFEEILASGGMVAETEKLKDHIFEKRKPVEYLQQLMLQTGFIISSVQVDGFRYRFENGTAFFSHAMIREFFMPAWENILPADRIDAVFSELESRLNRTAAEKGWLDMSVPFATFDLSK